MGYTEELKALRKSLRIKEDKKGLTHTINKKCPIFPFPTRNPERAKFSRGFEGVTGEFARIVSGNVLDQEIEMESVIKKISDTVNPDEKDLPYFNRLIRMFLSDDLQTMKIFHPHIYQYLPLTSGKEAKGETNIAIFIRDVLLQNEQYIQEFFTKSETDHLMSKLILDQLDYLKEKSHTKRYHIMMPMISDLFEEDIKFLMQHKDYFIENINMFLAYYYFFYITQLTLKLNQTKKADFHSVNEVVYTLDWEGASKSRIGYERGYQRIKDAAKNILVHNNCLEHLNFLLDTTTAKSYEGIREIFQDLSEEEKQDFLNVLKTWIGEYRYHVSLLPLETLADDFDGLVDQLFLSLDEGVPKETKTRFALSIEEIGKRYFLKTRGVLGYMLNISQDFLLLLTTISVKDERKSLKDVFREFEKRGVFFDRHSQDEVVQLFDKLNLLDKKSDSGDAQYVKPVL
ncbi:hypothetical protein GCM10008986_18940 [Salinibacillus aidingensis]|uniref:DNA phosphorothioation-dependent restriction protein DptG n=1 Tax=Salinibacillus aidingensis TaxID=237684 RepID=A0ABN1B9X3_9BACI